MNQKQAREVHRRDQDRARLIARATRKVPPDLVCGWRETVRNGKLMVCKICGKWMLAARGMRRHLLIYHWTDLETPIPDEKIDSMFGVPKSQLIDPKASEGMHPGLEN